jgi:hypothetical protein
MSYQDGRSNISSLLLSAYISVSLPMVCTIQTQASLYRCSRRVRVRAGRRPVGIFWKMFRAAS